MNSGRQPWWVTLQRALAKNPRQPWWVTLLITLTSACVMLFRHELGAWTAWIFAAFGLVYLVVRAVRPRAVMAISGAYPLFDAAALGLFVLLLLVVGDYYPTGITIAAGTLALGAYLALGEVCRRREGAASG